MAAEDVVTDLPLLTTPAMPPEAEASANIPNAVPSVPDAAQVLDGGGKVAQGGGAAEDLHEAGPSILIELRTANFRGGGPASSLTSVGFPETMIERWYRIVPAGDPLNQNVVLCPHWPPSEFKRTWEEDP